MTRIVDITDRDMVRALSHPLRRRVLAALRGRAASPVELAREFGEGIGTVSYHVRMLADAKLIELVEERPRRGATEHFYIAAGLAGASWTRGSPSVVEHRPGPVAGDPQPSDPAP